MNNDTIIKQRIRGHSAPFALACFLKLLIRSQEQPTKNSSDMLLQVAPGFLFYGKLIPSDNNLFR